MADTAFLNEKWGEKKKPGCFSSKLESLYNCYLLRRASENDSFGQGVGSRFSMEQFQPRSSHGEQNIIHILRQIVNALYTSATTAILSAEMGLRLSIFLCFS